MFYSRIHHIVTLQFNIETRDFGGAVMKMKKKKLIIIIGAVVLIILGTVFALTKGNTSVETVITKSVALKGDIKNTISGTGTVEPIDEYTIVATSKGEILFDDVEVGKTVKKGDLLYVVDSTDAENGVIKAKNSLEKQQMSYEQTLDTLKNLMIKAPFNGRISALYIEEGESINNGAKIADIVDDTVLTVKLPFIAADTKNIKMGDRADVYLEFSGQKVYGTVTKVSTGSYSNSYGALVSDIEISFENTGTILPNELVSAIINGYACNETGTANYKNKTTITSKTSGIVQTINFSEGDMVKESDMILELQNDSAVLNGKSGEVSLKDAKIALTEAEDNLNDCNIKSPIDGTVVDKYYKAGETLGESNNSQTLAIIADMSKLSFDMSIDELDIKNIGVGQKVNVTADALTNMTFEGEITNISILGSASNGVTTYPVTVVISEYEGLMPGMNVNAEIVSEEVKDVVMVPVTAISRGNVVLVTEDFANSLDINKTNNNLADNSKGNKSVAGQIVEMRNTPSGYKYIKVTTGLSNESHIEIKEGLNEGDEVYVISTAQKAVQTTSSTSSTGVGIGGMGMPMGQMPMNGGNFGGNSNRGSSTVRANSSQR